MGRQWVEWASSPPSLARSRHSRQWYAVSEHALRSVLEDLDPCDLNPLGCSLASASRHSQWSQAPHCPTSCSPQKLQQVRRSLAEVLGLQPWPLHPSGLFPVITVCWGDHTASPVSSQVTISIQCQVLPCPPHLLPFSTWSPCLS